MGIKPASNNVPLHIHLKLKCKNINTALTVYSVGLVILHGLKDHWFNLGQGTFPELQ